MPIPTYLTRKFLRITVTLAAICIGLLLHTPMRAAQQQPSQNSFATIPDGIPVRLSLKEALSSETSKVGDDIHLEVIEDVNVGGLIVIPGGTSAIGHILKDQHKKMLGRGGKLEFTIDYLKLGGDTRLKVRASAARRGKSNEGEVVTFSALLFPLSPFLLTRHGKSVQVPQDTLINAYIEGDQKVPMSIVEGANRFQAPPATAPVLANGPAVLGGSVSNTQPGSAALSLLNLNSEPPGAEITIDGEFVGDTPTTVQVVAGHHNVVLNKTGFKVWQRVLTVGSGGTISLAPSLEKAE